MLGKGKNMKKKANPEWVDGENPEWTDENFKNSISFSELPKSLQKKLGAIEKRGRPISATPKQMIAFRFSPDLIASIKAIGKGYNIRVEKIIREALEKSANANT